MALLELAVSDLALIERARVTLGPGFTVITGETGAGKSLLIDALLLVMGARSDAGLVREGAERARVEALFDRDPEPLICVREVAATGRSVARIDDETVPAARLAAAVAPLVEVHGQHDQGRLLSGARQRELLDRAGGHDALRASVAEAVTAWRANDAALRELGMAPEELERRLALAEHAAAEIEAARIRPGELDGLRAARAAAQNADRLARAEDGALALLAEDGSGARDRLAAAARSVGEAAALDPRLDSLAARLDGLAAEVDDATLELRRHREAWAEEEREAAVIEERLDLLYGLLRKYGETEEAVLAHGAAARADADRLRGLVAERGRRTEEGHRLRHEAEAAADALGAARRETALRLGPLVSVALAELGFGGAAFEVRLEPSELDLSGADEVAFILAPNPGEPARPLARIASGGELSRVALAIEQVLAAADTTPTLVFDEVDAGIGGRSADPVGRSLQRLAADHQVVCVTHLAQIAAYADHHLRIEKGTRDGRTVTAIRELRGDERIDELAQMLAGPAGVDLARATAAQLLERAQGVRGTR